MPADNAATFPFTSESLRRIRELEAINAQQAREIKRLLRERDDFEQRLHAYKSGEIA